MVDDEDYDKLTQYKWYTSGNNKYPCAARYDKQHGSIYMHREIMETPSGLVTDHIDHNRLNNQKANLRNCTVSQNLQNMKDTGRYQGVHWDTYHKKHRSRIRVSGVRKHLGYFDNPHEAAACYNRAAKKYYGEHAKLNMVVYDR